MQSTIVLLLTAGLLAGLAVAVHRSVAGGPARTPDTTVALVLALAIVGLGVGRIGDVSARLKSNGLPETVAPNRGVDEDPVVAAGLDPGFLAFAASKIAPSERFVVVCAAACDDTKRYLATYRLTPRVPQLDVAKADWIVFLGVAPAQAAVPALSYSDQQTYAEGYAIAKVNRP